MGVLETSQGSAAMKQVSNQEKHTLEEVDDLWCYSQCCPIPSPMWCSGVIRKQTNSQFFPSEKREKLVCNVLTCLWTTWTNGFHIAWLSSHWNHNMAWIFGWKPQTTGAGTKACQNFTLMDAWGKWLQAEKHKTTPKVWEETGDDVLNIEDI